MINRELIKTTGWKYIVDDNPSPDHVFCGIYQECNRVYPCRFRVNENNEITYGKLTDELKIIRICHDPGFRNKCNPEKVIDNLYYIDGTKRYSNNASEW